MVSMCKSHIELESTGTVLLTVLFHITNWFFNRLTSTSVCALFLFFGHLTNAWRVDSFDIGTLSSSRKGIHARFGWIHCGMPTTINGTLHPSNKNCIDWLVSVAHKCLWGWVNKKLMKWSNSSLLSINIPSFPGVSVVWLPSLLIPSSQSSIHGHSNAFKCSNCTTVPSARYPFPPTVSHSYRNLVALVSVSSISRWGRVIPSGIGWYIGRNSDQWHHHCTGPCQIAHGWCSSTL